MMTGLEIIQGIVAAGKLAYQIATGAKKKKEEVRKKISNLYEHIGKLLHETYTELNAGNYPHGHCQQLATFGNAIKNELARVIGKDAENLGNLLLLSYEVEQLARELNTGQIDKKELIPLEEASGNFLAASQLVLF